MVSGLAAFGRALFNSRRQPKSELCHVYYWDMRARFLRRFLAAKCVAIH